MKTFLRVFAVTVFLTTVGLISANAQDEKCPDLAACFELFKAELNKPACQRDKAVEIGEYIAEKFKDDVDNAELVKKIAARAAKLKDDQRICKRNKEYDDSYNQKRWDDHFKVAREIINDPTTDKGVALDVMLSLVSTGYDRVAVDKNDKFNGDSVTFAKNALAAISSGTLSKTGKWGTFDPFGTKDNAVSWMNYIVGFVSFNRMGDTKKEEGLQYFWKSTQIGEKATDPLVYREIGFWYGAKAGDLFAEYQKMVEANNKVATDEAKAKLALARGYADRAIDAFGRAQKVATDAKVKAAVTDSLTEFYKFRFNGKTDGLDKYVSDMIMKPMPDPTSAVTPVVLEETTATTSTTPTTPATPTSPATPATTKPAPTPKPTTPATSPATKPAASTAVKPAATSTKKPTQKKKATR